MNEAAINICVQDFLWTYVFKSIVKISSSIIAGSHGKGMFRFLRNCNTLFLSGCNIFLFLPILNNSSCCSILSPKIGIVSVLHIGHFNRYKVTLLVVLLCNSMMTCDVEHLPYAYLSSIYLLRCGIC